MPPDGRCELIAHVGMRYHERDTTGVWRRCKDGEIVEERWLGPRGDLMIGANLTSSPRGRASFEHMRIVRVDGVWMFWAEPDGRAATPFVLAESGPQRAAFSGALRLLARRRRPDGTHRGHGQGPAAVGGVALLERHGG